MFGPGPGAAPKRRAPSPDCVGNADGAIVAQRVSMSSSSSPLRPSSALSSSMSDLQLCASAQASVMMETRRQWENRTKPLDQRWARAITEIPFCGLAERNGTMVAASETVLQMQQGDLAANRLFIGLGPLKEWVRQNVQRVLIPPTDARQRAISSAQPHNSFCVTMSQDACGVRSYLQLVCEELRIDYFHVGGTYFEDEMLSDLLDEASERRRALVVIDRPAWFTTANYAAFGAVFMHHLRALMRKRHAAHTVSRVTAAGPLGALSNPLATDTLATLLPGLWIVVSSTGTDVASEVLSMANGSVLSLTCASKDVALMVVRMKLRSTLEHYGWGAEEIEQVLSQSPYKHQLDAISKALATYEVGGIVAVLQVALANAYARDSRLATHGVNMLGVLPTATDITQAINQLTGQSVGAASALMHETPDSFAAIAARAINSAAAAAARHY